MRGRFDRIYAALRSASGAKARDFDLGKVKDLVSVKAHDKSVKSGVTSTSDWQKTKLTLMDGLCSVARKER